MMNNLPTHSVKTFYLLLLIITTSACAVRPLRSFEETIAPPAPDYSKLENWAAHPDKIDPADRTPLPEIKDKQTDAPIDVLFFYPTTYTGRTRKGNPWNAFVADEKINQKTDKGTILFQASIFNGAGRVFAPRYRQAHLGVFYKKNKMKQAKQALTLAYSDVEKAFDYYMEHWNNGRPFIIASHSQGAFHAMQILKGKIEGTELQQKLVAAYIVGWPVRKDFFSVLKPCKDPQETNCFCTWRTWDRQFVLSRKNDRRIDPDILCTNPLNWSTEEGKYASKSENKGGVVRPYNKIYPEIVDAEVYHGLLLASRPKFKGSLFFRKKNFHIGDLNLYYMNVRENAALRTQKFIRK